VGWFREVRPGKSNRQVVVQGGGNMPAYGNNLSPAETTALVAFLDTLHPPRQASARDASQGATVPQPP